jgi:hypothetical protein
LNGRIILLNSITYPANNPVCDRIWPQSGQKQDHKRKDKTSLIGEKEWTSLIGP